MAKAFKEWFWEKPSGIRPWLRILPQEASGPGVPQPPVRAMPGSRPRACGLRSPTSHMRLLFLQISTRSGAMTRPVKGPISVPALIHVLEKMPRPSPGMELCAMITSAGSTRLDSFCTSAVGARGEPGQSLRQRRPGSCPPGPRPSPAHLTNTTSALEWLQRKSFGCACWGVVEGQAVVKAWKASGALELISRRFF